jgi:hypothetical protein
MIILYRLLPVPVHAQDTIDLGNPETFPSEAELDVMMSECTEYLTQILNEDAGDFFSQWNYHTGSTSQTVPEVAQAATSSSLAPHSGFEDLLGPSVSGNSPASWPPGGSGSSPPDASGPQVPGPVVPVVPLHFSAPGECHII